MPQQIDTQLSAQDTGNHYLIVGQGAIGLAVSNCLAAQFVARTQHADESISGRDGNEKGSHERYRVTGLARRERHHYNLSQYANFIQADACDLTAAQIETVTHIAIIVAPDNFEAQSYRQTYFAIASHIAQLADSLPHLQRVVFISSTGVYGQNNGEWIDDTVIPVPPQREASRFILQAEQVLQAAYHERAVIIRPSGIYGKDRQMRLRQAQRQDKEAIPLQAWTNRIMDTDLVIIISKVLTLNTQSAIKPMYLATDYAPVTSYDLMVWLCQKLNTTAPVVHQHNEISGKRLHSNIPRAWLNYPDWQMGYSAILQS